MHIINRFKKPIFLLALLFFTVASYGKKTPSVDTTFLTNMRALSESRGMVWGAYKNYVMIGMKNPYRHPKVQLSKLVQSYEKRILASRDYANKHNLSKMLPFLDQSKKEWEMTKKVLLDAPSVTQVNNLSKLVINLKTTIIKALNAMGSYDKSGNWLYLEQTQKAQNITQRMAAVYLSNTWGGLTPKRYEKLMQKTTENYEKVEKLIYKSKFLTPKIEKILQSAHKDYLYFKLMWKNGNHILIPTLIYKKSSDMDKKLGHCTTLIMQALTK